MRKLVYDIGASTFVFDGAKKLIVVFLDLLVNRYIAKLGLIVMMVFSTDTLFSAEEFKGRDLIKYDDVLTARLVEVYKKTNDDNWRRNVSKIELLIENGADPNIKKDHMGLLQDAVLQQQASLVIKCLNYGALIEATDFEGETALFKANNVGILYILGQAGANFNHRSRLERETALHSAVRHGFSYEVVKELCGRISTVMPCDVFGNTPLHAFFSSLAYEPRQQQIFVLIAEALLAWLPEQRFMINAERETPHDILNISNYALVPVFDAILRDRLEEKNRLEKSTTDKSCSMQ